jgi:hypothetical protein
VGILTGDMGHGVDQFEVTHDRASPWKRGNGQGNTPGSQRGRRENEKAARRNDLIMAALDPELRPLRDSAEQVLKRVRPKEVVITKLQVTVDPATQPPKATAVMIVRVTGEVIEKGSQGTLLAGVKVLLHKKGRRVADQGCRSRTGKAGSGSVSDASYRTNRWDRSLLYATRGNP